MLSHRRLAKASALQKL